MNDLIVVLPSSLPVDNPGSGTMGVYLNQLQDAGIDSVVLPVVALPYSQGAGNLAASIAGYRDIATRFSHYERLIISDAWDVTFYGSREDVIRKIPMDRCLIAAGKECWPDCSLRQRISGDTPWRFANGGLIAGTPANILKFMDAIEAHPRYQSLKSLCNQEMLNILLAEKSDAFYLDSRTELFFCLFDGYAELDFENGLPVNTLCGTHPQLVHANGHWDTREMYKRRERSLMSYLQEHPLYNGETMPDYHLYIPHVNREDLLRKAVDSVEDLREHLTIIDNSEHGLSGEFQGIDTIRPTVPLLFFQTMNFMLQESRRRNCKFFFFLHSDGEVHPGFALKMLELARKQTGKWGVIFSLYDVFAAYNTDLLEGVGLWDNNLPHYFADNDYYRRLRLAGYSVIEAGGDEVQHTPSSTVNSDPVRKFLNGVTFPLYLRYYIRRWGGEPGHEKFDSPFNGEAQKGA